MSGLEIAVGVAGIVSAFISGVTLFRDWRKERRERKEDAIAKIPQAYEVENSLVLGHTQVQSRYDQDFARLGRMFARGDGKLGGFCPLPCVST